ncbi:hypothetical protein GW932_02120 [archaeon]|nr:hypothetical protein [archaeon]
MDKKFVEKANDVLELSAVYVLSILFLYVPIYWIRETSLFQIRVLDKLIFATILLIVFFISLIMIQKIVLLQNIKPKLTQNEAKKIFNKIKKLNLRKKKEFEEYKKLEEEITFHEIKFNNFLEFFLFSTTIMTISLTSFMPIKQSFKALPVQIKNTLRKNQKPTHFAWRVFFNNKKEKEKLYFFYSYPKNNSN